MDVLIERWAGLDVHKDTVVACVRFPGEGGGQAQEVLSGPATELLESRDVLGAYLGARHGPGIETARREVGA